MCPVSSHLFGFGRLAWVRSVGLCVKGVPAEMCIHQKDPPGCPVCALIFLWAENGSLGAEGEAVGFQNDLLDQKPSDFN